MITFSKLGRHGNLGNSMFQLASTIGIAASKNYEVKLPRHETYFDTHYNCNNVSIFDGFDIDIPVLTTSDYENIKHVYREPYFHFSSDIYNIKDSTDLSGYLQTERYFKNVEVQVKKVFSFKQQFADEAASLFNRFGIDPLETTSLHIRRGDFLVKQVYHPLQSSQYFFDASKASHLKNTLIFSDGINWCKENIKGKNIYYSDLTSCFSDLKAISMCKNNIIVNSTFGWWGAWLNSSVDKTIIAPKIWFGPGNAHLNTSDIIPSSWTKL